MIVAHAMLVGLCGALLVGIVVVVLPALWRDIMTSDWEDES